MSKYHLLAAVSGFLVLSPIAQGLADQPPAAPHSTADAARPSHEQIPLAFTDAVLPRDVSEGDGNWILQIVTRGGLGRAAKGDFVITSRGALTCTSLAFHCPDRVPIPRLNSLADSVAVLAPSSWNHSTLSQCSDCERTLLVLRRREAGGSLNTHIAYWDVTTMGSVSPEVKRIYDLSVALGR